MSGRAGFRDESLERQYFATLEEFGEKHWWHRARREQARRAIEHSRVDLETAVDVGCGTGAMLPIFRVLGARNAIGTDASEQSARAAAKRGLFVLSDAARLPFRDEALSCVTSMDVIEHLDDDVAALRDYARVIRPGGLILLIVPAYPWLWSAHDELVGHRRRYTIGTLRSAAERSGFDITHITYVHAWLLPIATLIRKTPLRRLIRDSGEGSSFFNPVINAIFLALCRLESAIVGNRRLPFGTSILLTARPAEGRSPN